MKIETEKPLCCWDAWKTLMDYVMFLELEGNITTSTGDNMRHYLERFRNFAQDCLDSDMREEYVFDKK